MNLNELRSCKSYTIIVGNYFMINCFLDYDTHETVTCTSHYIYDSDRQRSLQHFLRINDLTLGCHTSDSASSSKFYHLALLVALVSCSSNFHY